jgi:hypothetical protein
MPIPSTPLRPMGVRTGNSGQAKAILEKNGFLDATNGGGLKDMPAR